MRKHGKPLQHLVKEHVKIGIESFGILSRKPLELREVPVAAGPAPSVVAADTKHSHTQRLQLQPCSKVSHRKLFS